MMEYFVEIMFIFFIGALSGWIIELFFRRYFSQKKWVNPGFLTGPYLPLYGFGLVGLYLVCKIDLSWMQLDDRGITIVKMIAIPIIMTLIEYIAGLIFIKGMKIKLWDYSNRWGNIQGIICPLFTVFWGLIGLGYYLFIHPQIDDAIIWLSKNLAFSFVIGTIFGIFIIDCFKSFNLANKIRKIAKDEKVVVTFEKFKANVIERERKVAHKVSFLNPMKTSEPINVVLKQYIETSKSKVIDFITITEEEADKLSIIGFITSLCGLNVISLSICVASKKSIKRKGFWITGLVLSIIEIVAIIVIMVLYALKVF